MQYSALIPGIFINRDDRFRATVEVDGNKTWAHVANSGRLDDLFVPGRSIWLVPAGNPNRKTIYDLKLVELPSGLVSVDARMPNPLLEEALGAGKITGFDYPQVEREVQAGSSRLDFRLSGTSAVCWVETKSVTLVRDGVALFPDVPTARGSKHLRELMALREQGDRAAVIFVIQREDVWAFAPHRDADSQFAATLANAAAAGVEIRAYRCRVLMQSITITDQVPCLS